VEHGIPVASGRLARMLRLVTIPISHYCEKARWALDRAGIVYREERHVQLVHRVAARRAGGGCTVPVLITDGGVLGQSNEILIWVNRRMPAGRRLFPKSGSAARAEVDALCRRFDDRLGPTGRRLIYVHMLQQRKLALSFNNSGVPAWEDRMLRLTWPLAAAGIRRALGIRPGIEIDDERAVWAELDFVGERLADGRLFLCGDVFGAADLTFAALASPVIAPPQYGTLLPQPHAMASATAELIQRARLHPAGRFAMRMFAEHRRDAVG
jgi:glutathione S-transferase